MKNFFVLVFFILFFGITGWSQHVTADDRAVTATTDKVEICAGHLEAAQKSCNETLSRLSMLSNSKVQITGSCEVGPYSYGEFCVDLSARVTIIHE